MTEQQIKEIWYSGFNASAEGFNGAHPFGMNRKGKKYDDLRAALELKWETWWHEHNSKYSGGRADVDGTPPGAAG